MYSCKYCSYQTDDKEAYFTHIRKSECSDKRYAKKRVNLSSTDITFGQYKDLTLTELLRDRKYCRWLLQQEWFAKQYEYLYNQVRDYNPEQFFLPKQDEVKMSTIEEFIRYYKYFNLYSLAQVKVNLSDPEKVCYRFYLDTIDKLKEKIYNEYTFNIKAPSSWLKQFEDKTKLSRDVFKEFLSAYGLPNITSIVEDIKKMAGIDYKGGKAYLIAKEKSLKQEKFWEDVLKKMYGPDIGIQFKYKNCIFDFVNTKKGILYECKLGWKDFDQQQYRKYQDVLGTSYSLIYLIGYDTVVDLDKKIAYTTKKDNQIGSFEIKVVDNLEIIL